MANLSNINNRFIVNDGGVGRVLIGDTTVPTSALTVSGQQELVKLTRGGASDSKWFFSTDSAKLYIAENTSSTADIKVTLQDNGNVGIGTVSPSADLHVNSENTAGTVIVGRTGTNIAASTSVGTITFPADYNSSATNYAQIRAYSNALSSVRGSLDFNVKSTSGSLITGLTVYGTSSGVNVGIGTTSPGANLEIFGTGNSLRLDSAANGSKEILFRNVGTGTAVIKTDGDLKLFVEDAGKNILFDTTGGEKMRITSGGIVEIGAIPSVAPAILSVRKNGTCIEYGHGNNNGRYEGTLGAFGTSGFPYIGFSTSCDNSVNTFTTRGWKGNVINSNDQGDLIFAQATNANASGQTLTERMRIKSNGQVNISQKPNSGLNYDLLINLGTSPDGLIGYQTREQFNNATLQKWYNVDAANSGSSQWVRLGTMSNFAQGGYTFCLTFYGHTGYNATNDQDFNCKLFMKTSNGGGAGPRFNTWVENTGKNVASPAFKWINTNASGTPTVGGTSYELYMNVPAYCNGSIYAINKHSGDWTSENAVGQTDPGANSTTVLQAQNVFNILNTDVGIGVTSPTYKLQVAGTTLISGGLKVIGPASYNTFQSGNDYTLGLNDYNSVSQWWLKAYATGDFALHENAVGDQFTIQAGGNVGINTTNPGAKLEVKQGHTILGGTQNNYGANVFTTKLGGYGVLSSGTDRYGSYGWLAFNSNNNYTGGARAFAFTNGYKANEFALLMGTSDQAPPTLGAQGVVTNGQLIFHVNSSADFMFGKVAGDGNGPHLQVNSYGYSSTFQGSSTSNMVTYRTGTELNTNVGALIFRDNGGDYCGQITVNGATNTTSYLSASDYRLKEDLKDFNGIDLVDKIPVYNFKWKKENVRTFGVLAHELKEVLPLVVDGDKDEEKYQTVDYSKIVPVLIKAIQELKAEIELLKSK